MKKFIIVLLLCFLLLAPPMADAYWTNAVLQSNQSATVTIVIGSWETSYDIVWEPNTTYTEGDVVLHQGVYYRRTRFAKGLQVSPTSLLGWLTWTAI